MATFLPATLKTAKAIKRHKAKTTRQVDALIEAFPKLNIEDRVRNNLLGEMVATSAQIGKMSKAEARLTRSIMFMNSMNMAQERMFRSVIFTNELNRLVIGRFNPKNSITGKREKGGMNLERAIASGNKDFLLTQDVAKALDKANDLTFSSAASLQAAGKLERLGARYIGAVNEFNLLAGLGFGEFFPRFFYNATKFTLDRTPFQFIKLFSPKERALMARGESDAVGKMVTGSTMFAMAFAMRSGIVPGIEPGPQYHQFGKDDADGKSVMLSFRAFAPVFVTQLAIADTVLKMASGRADEIRFRDIQEGILLSGARFDQLPGIFSDFRNFFDGTKDENDLQRRLESLLVSPIALLATGFRPLNDFGQEFSEEYRKIFSGIEGPLDQLQKTLPGGPTGDLFFIDTAFGNYTREFFGYRVPPAAFQTLPSEGKGIVPALPEARSPFQAGPLVFEEFKIFDLTQYGIPVSLSRTPGFIKQTTGITMSVPSTFVSRGLEDLVFRSEEEGARTGVLEINRLINAAMGQIVEYSGAVLFTDPRFQRLSRPLQRLHANEMLKESRQIASQAVRSLDPSIDFTLRVEKVSRLEKQAYFDILRRRGIEPTERLRIIEDSAVDTVNKVREKMFEQGQ